MGGRGSGRDMPGYPHVWGAVPEGWSSDLACNARQDADLRAVFGAFNKVFVIVSRRKTQLRGAATAQQWWSQEDQPAVGGLQLAQTTMDAAGGSSKRARAAGFEAPPDCKYHKLTQTQLKTAAEERGLVGKGPGQVPASSDKRRLHGALVAYDTAQAGAPGT